MLMSGSVLQHSNTPTLQHSSTPILQHSNTPTLRYRLARSENPSNVRCRSWLLVLTAGFRPRTCGFPIQPCQHGRGEVVEKVGHRLVRCPGHHDHFAPWRGLRRCLRPKVPPLVGADQRRPLSMLPSSLNRCSRRRILRQTQDCPLEIDDFQKPGKTSQRYPPALPA